MARNQNTQQQQAPKAREENELVDKLVGYQPRRESR